MPRKKMFYVLAAVVAVCLVAIAWKFTSRNAYETARYRTVIAEGPFELREYPDLMLATTSSDIESQGEDGSFMRLFRYISGENDQESKVAMTTPVFMEPETVDSKGQMSFVIPQQVAEQSVPNPSNRDVKISNRMGGRFAVFRFSGRMDTSSNEAAEQKLNDWIAANDWKVVDSAEFAGYDPPWTPGPLRRNEVLVRVTDGVQK